MKTAMLKDQFLGLKNSCPWSAPKRSTRVRGEVHRFRSYKAPFLACSKRYSHALRESARMESVGFLSGQVTKAAASMIKRMCKITKANSPCNEPHITKPRNSQAKSREVMRQVRPYGRLFRE
jgi:hypothetical protein